ncbi:unnamed protein product [Allacma fusca]|uniref:Platelet-derived growth factor (PDGF) family profile domain-containing protein n=1 Tax=Allacma fusca TaxID=39272 RepID=A0A8J2KRA8_9HEXA|nr:unnamed protein product [Allacma fusca]
MYKEPTKFLVLLVLLSLQFCNSLQREDQQSVSLTPEAMHYTHEALSHRNNRPQSVKTGTPIVFPSMNTTVTAKPKIPLKLIRDINNEDDIVNLFTKYVSNVKVKDVNGQKYFFDLNDNPIDVAIGETRRGTSSIGPFSFRNPITRKPGSNSTVSNMTPFTRNGNVGGIVPNRQGIEEKITKGAACEPEMRTVEVPTGEDHGTLIIPRCVRIPQCGGCCGSSLLKCEAVSTKTVKVQVNKFEYQQETGKVNYVKSEHIVELQAATKCRCGCRIKPRDCSPAHNHDHTECQCVCKNDQDRPACQEQEDKQWNPQNCQCECREIKECSSGYTFSPQTCTCQPDTTPLSPSMDSSEKKRRRRMHKRRHIK